MTISTGSVMIMRLLLFSQCDGIMIASCDCFGLPIDWGGA